MHHADMNRRCRLSLIQLDILCTLKQAHWFITRLKALKKRGGRIWKGWLYYVPVNSKTAHAPPGKPRGIWLFLKNFGQIPHYVASLDGQMLHPLELQRGSNLPPARHVKAAVETSSVKFSATTNFLFSLSSLRTLNKGIFQDITIQNNNNRKTHVESTRAMTRERRSRAESKNCEIL